MNNINDLERKLEKVKYLGMGGVEYYGKLV